MSTTPDGRYPHIHAAGPAAAQSRRPEGCGYVGNPTPLPLINAVILAPLMLSLNRFTCVPAVSTDRLREAALHSESFIQLSCLLWTAATEIDVLRGRIHRLQHHSLEQKP